MIDAHKQFGIKLAEWLTSHLPDIKINPHSPTQILLPRNNQNNDQQWVAMELTPIRTAASNHTVADLFDNIHSISQIIDIYRHLKSTYLFEEQIESAMTQVHSYADQFIEQLIKRSLRNLDDKHARLIANWIKHLDPYTCVKAIESLLYSKADLQLLAIADQQKWNIHFDHLAIRCGSQANQDAERIVDFLVNHHGYSMPQIQNQRYYRFNDGWNAYVLFKILMTGQAILLFIDQSNANQPEQIIQHWNRVYGYSAHHLAIRITDNLQPRNALSLEQIASLCEADSIRFLTPTGLYTHQLLEQVFTRPEQNKQIPESLLNEIALSGSTLPTVLLNGKLLELVSRRELPESMKKDWFNLYGITYQPDNPLHSAPAYSYFLPAQAAHVIRTSVETQS